MRLIGSIKCGWLFIGLALQACSPLPGPPPRPANVPADAARVQSSDRTVWIKCSRTAAANECQIYNAAGEPIYDEVFLPYDGGPPVPDHELEVDTKFSNFAYVHLRNGRILLPSTNFERHKELMDGIARSAEEKK